MRKSLSRLRLSVPFLLVALSVGCSQSTPADASGAADTQAGHAAAESDAVLMTVNQTCPIMGGKVTSDGGTVEWNGKLIGFCCPGCEPKWEKLTDNQKTEKLAEASHNTEGDAAFADPDRS